MTNFAIFARGKTVGVCVCRFQETILSKFVRKRENEKETNIIHRHVYGKHYWNGSKRKREFGKD